jgi:hypothetical protein
VLAARHGVFDADHWSGAAAWEKATLAHVYCLERKLRGATGFARHWHDLVRLDEAGFAAAAMADRDLSNAVADHKAKFFPAKDAHAAPVDYTTPSPDTSGWFRTGRPSTS